MPLTRPNRSTCALSGKEGLSWEVLAARQLLGVWSPESGGPPTENRQAPGPVGRSEVKADDLMCQVGAGEIPRAHLVKRLELRYEAVDACVSRSVLPALFGQVHCELAAFDVPAVQSRNRLLGLLR